MTTDGQTPWEATQVATLQVLMIISQKLGDELVGGPAASIPRVAPEHRQNGTKLMVGPWSEAEVSELRVAVQR
jgi:hypothetical protein